MQDIKPYCSQIWIQYLKDYCRYPSRCVFLTQKIKSLCRNNTVDILQCENAYMNRYLPETVIAPAILVEHEILSVSFYQRAKIENRLSHRLISFARALKKRLEEKMWYKKFDKIIVFSENDKQSIRKFYNLENIEVVPLGVDAANYPQQFCASKPYDLLFVGNFSHRPNVDAVLYFYRRILPILRDKIGDIVVVFAGANPPQEIEGIAKSDKGILVTGYVSDILEIYSKSKVFIAPIRYGTGMRYKILEALVMKIPIVATTLAVRGIVPCDAIKIADRKEDFVATIIELLSSQAEHREALGRNGRSLVEDHYNLEKLTAQYEQIYYDLVSHQ